MKIIHKICHTLISGMSHDASQSSQYTCRAPPSGGWSGGWGSLSSRQLRKRAGPVNAGFAEGDDAGQIRQRVWPIKGESAMYIEATMLWIIYRINCNR